MADTANTTNKDTETKPNPKSERIKNVLERTKRGGMNSTPSIKTKNFEVMEPIIAKSPLKEFAALTPKDMGDMGLLISTNGEVIISKGTVLTLVRHFKEHSSFVVGDSDFELQIWSTTLDKLAPYQPKYMGETSTTNPTNKKPDPKPEASKTDSKAETKTETKTETKK